MNYFSYLVYLLSGFVALILPISIQRLAWLFIVSVVLDEQRAGDISVTNILLMALVFRAAESLARNSRIVGNPLVIALTGLVPLLSIAAFISTEPERLKYLFSILSLIAGSSAIIVAIKTPGDLRLMINAVFWMSGLCAAAVFCELIAYRMFGFDFWGGANEYGIVSMNIDVLHATGIFDVNAISAVHILPGLALSVILRESATTRAQRQRLGYYGLLTAGALVATISRAAIIALIVLAIVVLARGAFRGEIWKLGVLVCVVAVVPPLLDFIAGFNKDSYYSRYAIIWGAVDLIEAKPLFGGGLATRVVSAARADSWGLEAQASGVAYDQSLRDTHNTVLQIGVETGLIGLAFFGGIMALVFSRLYRVGKYARDPWFAAQVRGMFWTLLIVLFLCASTVFSMPNRCGSCWGFPVVLFR